MPIGGRVTVTVNEAALKEVGVSPGAVRLMSRVGEVVTQEAKRLCPVSPAGSEEHRSGYLRSSVGWKLETEGGQLATRVGTDVDYALPVILGTRPHVIESHGDYPLRNAKTGEVFGRVVQHPGTAPQDFLRPALLAVRTAV